MMFFCCVICQFFVAMFEIVRRMSQSWYACICILWLIHGLCPHLVVNLYSSWYQKNAHTAPMFIGSADPARYIAMVSGNGGPGLPHVTAICKENACGNMLAAPEQTNASHAATNHQHHLRQQANKHPCDTASTNELVATKQMKKRLRQHTTYSPIVNAPNRKKACGHASTNDTTCGTDATKPDAPAKERNHLV